MLALAAVAALSYLRVGHARDVVVQPKPGYALMGGGQDLDQAFQWMCQLSRDGDFLIVRSSGTDAYNAYVAKLCPRENSVATLILPSRAAAMDPAAARAIRGAAAIFIAGGDQATYVNYWGGTPVQRELDRAAGRGVPMGGTSAGLAVLGQFAYSAQHDAPDGPDLTSAAALANPFHPQVVIVRDYLAIPALRGVIFDTHFHNRDRLGRLLVFLARTPGARGIGVDQHTALLLDEGGEATVVGTGAAYFISASSPAGICRPGQPLSFAGLAVLRQTAGQRFNLRRWSGAGAAYSLSVDRGTIKSTQAGGGIY